MGVVIKSPEEVVAMREAGRIVAKVLETLAGEVKPGVKTRDLDAVCVQELARHGAQSSFKNYHGYPAHICTSVNDEVVHGIPGDRTLCEGDIVSIDVGVIQRLPGDFAVTVGVGKITSRGN
jgi:methionyl aminopeptidase